MYETEVKRFQFLFWESENRMTFTAENLMSKVFLIGVGREYHFGVFELKIPMRQASIWEEVIHWGLSLSKETEFRGQVNL